MIEKNENYSNDIKKNDENQIIKKKEIILKNFSEDTYKSKTCFKFKTCYSFEYAKDLNYKR
jgi:hypothetical protein